MFRVFHKMEFFTEKRRDCYGKKVKIFYITFLEKKDCRNDVM